MLELAVTVTDSKSQILTGLILNLECYTDFETEVPLCFPQTRLTATVAGLGRQVDRCFLYVFPKNPPND